MSRLIAPHGGQLVNLFAVSAAERVALKREAAQLPAWDLSARQACTPAARIKSKSAECRIAQATPIASATATHRPRVGRSM